ncbi:MAG: hypothetical protein COW24_00255 [Candidatus Kerfeldbacteria bacterium CG15_BIG_FIL_POST_REV_8_21_14_020_45_12]|uniref:Cell division protein FtsX n=1 Tax=Candidatus Kerfeldbacteria bacterium CG15_BIG_FIL_POST_REV_8_21_14_020_45_12 TaxID=2014247 RepID=A0A2M7H5A7_9BACT|nr:MAG: hypothetical protein COW24_00255 [Candidatus Kerfeldbacteria bacterium CG15_BIG_FIL_POST_REV_8_21_14_020_45_12]PJA93714.1 MAG: hypothetical protein CO132_01585 [Candidatus Kerfeldbacteria bacterium CG_4_9_14_3_um_filter_45_8]
MIVGIFRTVKYALQNSWRNLWLSVVTIFLLVLTTFSITLVVGLNVMVQQVIRAVESNVEIDLLFHTYVPEADILEAQKFVNNLPGVTQVIYISQEQALETYRQDHAGDAAIIATLDELDENVLPASLTVRADEIDKYQDIVSAFEGSEYADLVDVTNSSDSEDIIRNIRGYTDSVYKIGLAVSFIFIVISVIVIFNTIRIAIYNHRESIGIMKLVGATNWFIRGPFLFEGVILGALAACITLIIFYGLLYLSNPQITAFFAGYDFSAWTYFVTRGYQVIVLEVVGGVLLSVISTMVAITRYLRV